MKTIEDLKRESERGAITILMALAMVGIIGIAAFAVDIGSALVTKAELQNSADAASLAGTSELATIYKGLGNNKDYKQYTLNGTQLAQIRKRAADISAANKAAYASVSTLDADIETGTFTVADGKFTPTLKGVRAVRVMTRRDASVNGEVDTTLGQVLGVDQLAITASAASGLSALGTLNPGEGEFPIGLSEQWFVNGSCENNPKVVLHPTNDPKSCAGWHTFDSKPASAAKLAPIVQGIKDGTFVSPKTIAGQTRYEFIGGDITPRIVDLKEAFEANKGADGFWHVNVPVYESSDCKNPNKDLLIIGFAKMRIEGIQGPPSKLIEGFVECGIHDEGEIGSGGGPNDFGVLVSKPGMIQ